MSTGNGAEVLIGDATYEATPKQMRADLHERFASWLRTVAADRITEHEETVGFHLEQALIYRAQLGLDREPADGDQSRWRLGRPAQRDAGGP